MSESQPLQNWSKNFIYSTTNVHYPETIEQVQEVVRRATKIRALGSRHAFNAIADSPVELISLAHVNPTESARIDRVGRTVTVAGNVRYGDLARQIDQAGFALPNLASLPHISIAGACATATHGSGDKNGCLPTSVAAIELVTADGEIVSLSRDKDGDRFLGAVVGLGGLGVVTHLTLDLLPSFTMRQTVYENLPMAALSTYIDELTGSAYSVSFFTDWRTDRINQVWLKQKVVDGEPFEAAPDLYGATLATTKLHPIRSMSPINATDQLGMPGVWYDRLPHFRLDFTPSSGDELQTEYILPRRFALPALEAVGQLRDRIAPLLQISEIRLIAADDLWMSMAYQQDSIGIHFTWVKDWEAVRQVTPLIEQVFAPFMPRPHWGKLFTLPADRVQAAYPRLANFRQLVTDFDPHGKFRNPFLDAYIFGE